jgi:hypothetical protein
LSRYLLFGVGIDRGDGYVRRDHVDDDAIDKGLDESRWQKRKSSSSVNWFHGYGKVSPHK